MLFRTLSHQHFAQPGPPRERPIGSTRERSRSLQFVFSIPPPGAGQPEHEAPSRTPPSVPAGPPAPCGARRRPATARGADVGGAPSRAHRHRRPGLSPLRRRAPGAPPALRLPGMGYRMSPSTHRSSSLRMGAEGHVCPRREISMLAPFTAPSRRPRRLSSPRSGIPISHALAPTGGDAGQDPHRSRPGRREAAQSHLGHR